MTTEIEYRKTRIEEIEESQRLVESNLGTKDFLTDTRSYSDCHNGDVAYAFYGGPK